MNQFNDLKFKPNTLGGVGAHHTFENGVTISVQASKFAYCTPRENLPSHDFYLNFEVALWDDSGWLTREKIGGQITVTTKHHNDVIPRQNREEIDELIKNIN